MKGAARLEISWHVFPGDPTGKSNILRNIWTQKVVRAFDGGAEWLHSHCGDRERLPFNPIKEKLIRSSVCFNPPVKNWVAVFNDGVEKAFSTFLDQQCTSALVLWWRSRCMKKYMYRTIDCFQYQSSYHALTPTQINLLTSVGMCRVQCQGRIQPWVSMLHNKVLQEMNNAEAFANQVWAQKHTRIFHILEKRIWELQGVLSGVLRQSVAMHLPLQPCFAVKAIPWWERKWERIIKPTSKNKISFTIGLLLLHCSYRQITWQTLLLQHRSKL